MVRNGRIVAAGGACASKLPAGAQMIDATGKWVTPGIVAGFSRLGLAEVDLSADGADDTSATTARSAPRSTSCRRSTRCARTIAVNRADGVTRAIVAPSAGKSIFAGQGAVIDTGADMDPITAARKFQFVELGETGAGKAGGSRASAQSCSATRCARPPSFGATLRRSRRRAAAPGRARAPVVRNPNESRLTAPTRGAARTCC